jgi:hypothetical protein
MRPRQRLWWWLSPITLVISSGIFVSYASLYPPKLPLWSVIIGVSACLGILAALIVKRLYLCAGLLSIALLVFAILLPIGSK